VLISIISPGNIYANDDWQLRKEENGIKVYTKEREETQIYMYKVITEVKGTPEEVFNQAVDFRENLKYMELVDSLAFLDHKKGQRYINYMRFDMPWPVTNREMVMDMHVRKNANTIYLESNELSGYIEKNKGLVQIEDFHEEWEIRPANTPGKTKIQVTGWVNPGGKIPTWIVNLFSVRTPYRFISGIRYELEK
jgi:hypothetical protein